MAADGGALFVDLLGDLTLSRSTLNSNRAFEDGGGINAGVAATVTMIETKGASNTAAGSGGFAYLFGITSANLDGVVAIDNEAGTSGGAVAIIATTRTISNITNTSIQANRAGSKGGGLYVEDAAVTVTGTQLLSNSVEQGDGGGAVVSGGQAQLSLSNTKCVSVEVLVDWSNAGEGCSVGSNGRTTCDSSSDIACKEQAENVECSGCACNK